MALVVASGILLVLGILSAVVAAQATDVGQSSNRSRASARALAGALAGLERAVRDVNANPATCPAAGGDANCGPTTPEQLGNSTTFEYEVSPVLNENNNGPAGFNASECVGSQVRGRVIDQATQQRLGTVQRCVTSIGRSAGQVRRVQARISGLSEFQLFPVGLTSRRRLCIGAQNSNPLYDTAGCQINASGQQSQILSDIAANEYLISGGNNLPPVMVCGEVHALRSAFIANPTRVQVGNCTVNFTQPDTQPPIGVPDTPSTFSCPNGATTPCAPIPVELSPPGFEAQDLTGFYNVDSNGDGTPDTDTTVVNSNDAWIDTLVAVGGPCSNRTKAQIYTTDRVLDLDSCSNGTYTIPAGTYNFCRLDVGTGVSLTASGATAANPVRILIDSPYRAGSGCDAGQPFNTADDASRTGWTPFTSGSWDRCAAAAASCADGSLKLGQQPRNTTPDARAMMFFVWGNPTTGCPASGGMAAPYPTGYQLECAPPQNIVDFQNGGDLNFGIVAPWTNIRIRNSGNANNNPNACFDGTSATDSLDVCGAFFAWDLDIGNGFVFREDARFRLTTGRVINPVYFRANWNECTREPRVATDPRSGC